SSQPLLQEGERASTLLSVVPGHDFAVEDHVFGQASERVRQFRKRLGDLVAGTRKDFYFAARTVSLRANAVVLVLDFHVRKIAEGLFGGLDRAGQHESERMKQAHASFLQPAV